MVTAVAAVGAAAIASSSSSKNRRSLESGARGAKGQADLARGNIRLSSKKGRREVRRGAKRAGRDIIRGTNQAIGALDPGTAQLQLEALSGAAGPEAQAAAFQAFQDSPEQAFLREQGEQATIRQSSALGGLGGGNVRRELQRQAIGLASQDFSNRFNRLGVVQGIQGQRQTNISNLLSGQGTNLANINSARAQQLASIRTNQGTNLANIRTGQGAQQAQLAGQIGQARAQESRDLLNIGSSLLSGVDFGGGGGGETLPARGGRGFGSGGL